MLTLISVVVAAIIFEYSNGFHDAANAIATVVSTRVLTPRKAIAMAAFFNLTGALFGGAVASTIGKGLVDTDIVTMTTVLSAVIAAFAWNIATWWFGLPSSSSHSLIGGLCGAALATAHGHWSVIKWNAGVWPKVIVPMVTSPFAGFIFGGLLMFLLFVTLQRFTPHFVQSLFGKLQIFSAAWMAHSHGTNDAQKTMGIITLALFTGTRAGNFDHGRGCGETFQRHEMESRRANHLGLAFYPAGEWPCWLCAGAGRRGALISRNLWVKIARRFDPEFLQHFSHPLALLWRI